MVSRRRAAPACPTRECCGGRPHRWHQLFPQRPAHRCLSLAIVADGEPVIGVVYDPNHRELFHALRAMARSTTLRSVRTRDDGQRGRDGRRHLASRHPADFLPFLQALLSDGGMFIRNGSGR